MIIEAENITKIYRSSIKEPGLRGTIKSLYHSEWQEKTAVDSISFSMKQGQTLACIGENGAGKSTLIKMLIGILKPTSGSLKVYGRDPMKRNREYLRKIGVIFGQKTNLWIDIPVIESYQAIKTMYKVEDAKFKRNFEMVVELLDLAEILPYPARKLSLGQRMKADIGLVFLHSPEILYLDEPTIGLDINVKHTIRSFIRSMNQETGVSVLLTSHDLDDIDEICEDAIILSKGKLFYEGTLDQLKHQYGERKVIHIIGNQRRELTGMIPNAKVERDGKKTSILYKESDYSSEAILNIVSSSFDIEDITIQGPDIDYVVSQIFSKGRG